MRSRVFKLFIVFMLVVGIFVNNKAIIKAEDQAGRVIIRDVNFCIEFVFNKNTSTFEPTDQSKLEEFRKMGFDFACSDPENQVFELRVVSEKVCLRYPESCPPDFKIIESTTPLHITTPEKYTDNHTLTFAGEKQYDGKTSSENIIDVTGIKCDADLNIEKIKIEFFPDLKGSYLRNEEDEFVDIEIGEHYISLGECGTHSLRTDNVIIMANGTKAIDISHKESSPESGSIQMYNSVFEINAVYQKPQELNYNNCEPIIELESNFTIGKESVVTINANVPEKVANDSESSGPFFVEEEAILDTKSLSVKDSSLTINDENYKYYMGIMAEHIDVSDNSSLNIDGALVGIEYNNVNEKGGDKQKSLLKEGGFGTEELTVPGFYFDGSINITSYFVGVEMRTKKNPTDVPLKFNYMSNNEISSTIRILGRDEDIEKLDADYITIKLFNLTDNSQFDLDYNEDKYLVFSSTSSERNVEPKYYQEFYIEKLDTYRAIRISSIVAAKQILYINTPKKQVIYNNGITEDEGIAALDVRWNSIEGYTINVTDNYTFEKNLDMGISPFIDCKGANLRITGENKTLAFNIIHSQDERKRGNGFVFVSVDPSYNTQFAGVSEDKKLNIVVSENGELPSDASIASFVSNAQSIRPTTTSLSASSNGKVSFNYVTLEARTYSSLFNLMSSDLSINNSSINYGYAYTTYPYTDSLSVIRAVNAEFIKSNINIVGHECLCTKDTIKQMRSTGVHSLGKISFEDCEKVNIQKFDCGIRVFSTNPEERTYAGTFLSKNSSLEINCCKCGIYTSECMIDVNKGNYLRVSVDEVFKDEEQHYLNPAIYVPSYVEYMIKASGGSKIIGETIEGKIEPIKSTTELNNYKSVEVITGDPESDKLLIVASRDFGVIQLYSTDCPKEDPEEDDQYTVYYDEDFDSFVVILKEDFVFERKKDDEFMNFIETRNAGFIVKGDVTLTFKYDLNGVDKYYQGSMFRCFDIDDKHNFILENNTDDGRLKIVMKETTNTDTPIKVDDVINSAMIHSDETSTLLTEVVTVPIVSIKNVDIQANTFGQLLALGSHNTEIINSNINFEFCPLNFKEEKPVINKTCFQTIKDIKIEDSNIEIIGNSMLNNFSKEEVISIDENGAMISKGSISVTSNTGKHYIKIKDYLFGIGAFGTINIDNVNLDVEGHRGGIGSFGECQISLSSTESYVKIKSNVTEHPVISLYEPLKLPAVFGYPVSVNGPLGVDVYAYDIEHNKEKFNKEKMIDYVYVTIQEENVPWPTPTHMVQVEAFIAPTENKPGSLPYYQDENGHYYEDPDGKLPIKQDIEEWKKNQSIPKLESKYKGKLSLVTPKMEEGIVKLITIDTIVTPVDESNIYAIMMDVEHQGDKNIYLIIDGHKVPFVQEPGTDNICFILENDYLNDLLDKEHEYYVVTSNGSATSKFKIEYKKVDPPGPPNPGHDSGYKIPKTGIR